MTMNAKVLGPEVDIGKTQLRATDEIEAALKKLGDGVGGLGNYQREDDGDSFRMAMKAAKDLNLDLSKITEVKVTDEISVTRKSAVQLIAAAREFARAMRDPADEERKDKAGKSLADALYEANETACAKGDIGVKAAYLQSSIARIKGEYLRKS